MQIVKAVSNDYPAVREFYYALTDEMEQAEFTPGWIRDIYPTQEYLKDSIRKGELYIGRCGEEIAACMVVNHDYNEAYRQVKWSVEAEDSEVLMIHTLGVRRKFSGRGLAKQLVQEVIDMAENSGIRTIRLDVLKGNLPAEKVYLKMGFRYVDTLPMYYEDTGITDYKAFERLI